ncbi:Uma2 family endonuclease [Rhodoplanes sp. TEM]|uniref:Uma2 family endonuclease n=1 Tax=Rhodoplanes tepidamans TaxID=200616 RepID=A0ABT5J5A9_RHOTP|nr:MULTISPECIES: Uma2 family endonuclease [Rhodoplanes]MDC7784581.1 Uma2 family endonuclease [Rhodoplanes tepidamans]MDC7988039.1 Uma2 family endonuclease [Rhodoplanes sp. TEM]MDQ0355809.1 Uma2 family endonuclease [Rhodoplanes tepidamans]
MGVEPHEPARPGRMSGEAFRRFQDGRPDHERWELIAGVPMMMTPPTIAHNRIAGNLERLLNDALAGHDRTRLATQRPGLDLGSGDFRPEPDVGVIDADYAAGQRFVERAFLLAEIVSDSDDVRVPGTDRAWIEVKRDIYLAHPACEAVLIVEQERIEVRVFSRGAEGWIAQTLGPDEETLSLPGFGLACPVAALYEGTPLRPRRR